MPTPTQDEFERLQAIISHTVLSMCVHRSYPSLSLEETDALIVGIIDRMARLRGWSLRRERVPLEELDGE